MWLEEAVALPIQSYDNCCVKGSDMQCSVQLSQPKNALLCLGLESGRLPPSSKQKYTKTYSASSSEIQYSSWK